MDAERLTPYLRRRVLNLSMTDRVALRREIDDSIAQPQRVKPCDRLRYLADKMQEVAEVDVRQRSRLAAIVEARGIFVFVARCEGISQLEIGRFLKMNHSTVSFTEKKVRGMFEVPAAFKETIGLYNQYTNAIL